MIDGTNLLKILKLYRKIKKFLKDIIFFLDLIMLKLEREKGIEPST